MASTKDFSNDQDIRWCPGCGDHAILKHFQSALAKTEIPPHKHVVVSGIGCASRLPYYMSTYGFHTIHGRALPIASGLKWSRPDMHVWVITGDGDALSIGGNHYIHLFRRDLDINILLFNNEVYGLTKGQASPTSKLGQFSKSTPLGSEEMPINGLLLALTSGASFVSRTFDRDTAYIQQYFLEAHRHKGSSIVEILQNCPIFNDGVFDKITNKQSNAIQTVRLEHGKPLIFGEKKEFSIVLDGFNPKIVPSDNIGSHSIWIHDEQDMTKASILSEFGYQRFASFPVAIGVLYRNERVEKKKQYENYLESLPAILNKGKINNT